MKKLRLLFISAFCVFAINAINAQDLGYFNDGYFAYSITSFNNTTKSGTVRMGFTEYGRDNFNSETLVIPETIQRNDSVFVIQIIGDKSSIGTSTKNNDGSSVRYVFGFKNGSFKNVVIPNSVHTLDYNAFEGCENLKTVTIQGDGLSKIRDKAFYGCQIQDLYLPASVNDICNDFSGAGCFRGIKNVHIDNEKYKSFDGIVYSPDQSILYAIPEYQTSCVLSPNTKKVFSGAAGGGELQNLVLNEGLEEIGELAFNSNPFTNVVIPSTVKRMGRMAFYEEPNMISIQFEGSYIQSLGESAFSHCKKLENITFPEKVDTIYDLCFYETAIKELYIPDYTVLHANVFPNCKNLTYVYIPKNVKIDLTNNGILHEIGMFSNCTNLVKIENLSESETIPQYFAYNCSKLPQYTFSDKTKRICDYAFENCSSIRNIKLPNSVLTIDYEAFANCTQLTHVTLPSRIKTMSNELVPKNYTRKNGRTFYNNKITEMTLPAEFEYGQNILDNKNIQNLSFYVMGDTIPQSLAYYSFTSRTLKPSIIENFKYYNEFVDYTSTNFSDWYSSSTNHDFLQELIAEDLIKAEDIQNVNNHLLIKNEDIYYYLYSLTTEQLRSYLVEIGLMSPGDLNYQKYGSSHFALFKYLLRDLGYESAQAEWEETDVNDIDFENTYDWLGNEYGLNEYSTLFEIPSIREKLAAKGIGNFSELKSYMSKNFTPFEGQTEYAYPHIFVKKSVYEDKYPNGKWTTTIDVYNTSTRKTTKQTVTFDVGYKIPIKFKNNYMTLCRDFDVDLTDPEVTSPELKAWLAADVDFERTAVAMQELRYIPSRTLANVPGYTGVDEYHGVVMEGKPGNIYFYKIGEQDYTQGNGQILLTDVQEVNMMEGANDDEYVYQTEINKEEENCVNYGLKDDKFRIFTNEGWLVYNKSYLSLPDDIGYAKNLTLEFESLDGTTKIVKASDFAKLSDDSPAFNLQGQKISDSYKGIIIKNGKKFIQNKK